MGNPVSALVYPIKAELGGGYRAVVVDKRRGERERSPVCSTMQEGRHWARQRVAVLMGAMPWTPGYIYGSRWTMNVFTRD